MPRFEYVAYDSSGAAATGSVDATDRAGALTELRRRGLAVSELEPRGAATTSRAGSDRQPAWSRLAERLAGPRPLRTRDIAAVVRALAVSQSAGVPIVRAVAMLAEEGRGERTGLVLEQIGADLADGAALSEAMRRQERRIGSVPCAIVEAGEATGQLERALERLADMLETEAALRRRLWAAASHPLFTVSFAVVVFVVMIVFVVPAFEAVYEDFETPLPALTATVLTLARTLLRYFYLVPVGAAAVVGCYLWLTKDRRVRIWRDRNALRLPLVGGLLRSAALSRIVSVVGSALSVGVPLRDGLGLARGAAGNLEYERVLQRVRDEVSEGSGLYPVIAGDSAFPPLLRQVVRVGEESATLADSLLRYGRTLEAEIESASDRVVSLTEIGLIVAAGGIVAFMLVVLYLPILNLAQLA